MHYFHIMHVLCSSSTAEWTTPTITGDTPPPMRDFSCTKLSGEQAVMFGGFGPEGCSSDLRVATIARDSVVSMLMSLMADQVLETMLVLICAFMRTCDDEFVSPGKLLISDVCILYMYVQDFFVAK